MSEMTNMTGAGHCQTLSAGPDGEHPQAPHRRKRRPWRIALIAVGSLLGLAIAVAAGGYAYVNHLASGIPRIKVANLVASTASGQTILVTANPFGPTAANGQSDVRRRPTASSSCSCTSTPTGRLAER